MSYRVTAPFLGFAPRQELLVSGACRTAFNFHIILLPWLIGAATMTALHLPVIAIVSIIYPISSGMVFIFPRKNAERVKEGTASGKSSLVRPAWPLYVVLLGAVLVFRSILAPGIPF